jgi:hypothetical protein
VKSGGLTANSLLRHGSALSRLRRVPILGGLLSWTIRWLVARDRVIWIQIRQDPAQGPWIRVSHRSVQDLKQGTGEPAVQQALQYHLRLGLTF